MHEKKLQVKLFSRYNFKLIMFETLYLINIPQLTVDVLANFQQQAYGTLIEDMKVEEEREQPLGKCAIL